MKDIARFLSGFKDFQQTYFCTDNKVFRELRKGQQPTTMVVACSDSRVDPAILMGCEPGDIFVMRNIANLVPPYEDSTGHHGVSAALEYAVKCLKVEHIIVQGHSSCGGIQGLMSPERKTMGEFVFPWVSIAEQALQQVEQELAAKSPELKSRACELAAILISLDNLLTFPWIASRVKEQKLYLHGWYFDMESGELLSYLPETKSFETIVPNCEF